MTKENPVYFKLEYDESIESKKDILSAEFSLLNLIKSIKKYQSIRAEEFRIKNEIHKAVKKLNLDIRKTQSSFPFIKLSGRTKKEDYTKKEKTQKIEFNKDLESELREIQNRLASLSR
jgi:hypothetical protein